MTGRSVITTELAPEPFDGTDINPRCPCNHDEHCRCRENPEGS